MQTLNAKLNSFVKSQNNSQLTKSFLPSNQDIDLNQFDMASLQSTITHRSQSPIEIRTEATLNELPELKSQIEDLHNQQQNLQTKITFTEQEVIEKSQIQYQDEQHILEQLMLKYEPEIHEALKRQQNSSVQVSRHQNSILSEISVIQGQEQYEGLTNSKITRTPEEQQYIQISNENFRLKKLLAVEKCNFRERRDQIQKFEENIALLQKEYQNCQSVYGIIQEKLEVVKNEVSLLNE